MFWGVLVGLMMLVSISLLAALRVESSAVAIAVVLIWLVLVFLWMDLGQGGFDGFGN